MSLWTKTWSNNADALRNYQRDNWIRSGIIPPLRLAGAEIGDVWIPIQFDPSHGLLAANLSSYKFSCLGLSTSRVCFKWHARLFLTPRVWMCCTRAASQLYSSPWTAQCRTHRHCVVRPVGTVLCSSGSRCCWHASWPTDHHCVTDICTTNHLSAVTVWWSSHHNLPRRSTRRGVDL